MSFYYRSLFSVNKIFTVPTQSTDENAIANEAITYVTSAVASILLLLLCFVLGFLCYRRLHHKQEKRLFFIVITSNLQVTKQNTG